MAVTDTIIDILRAFYNGDASLPVSVPGMSASSSATLTSVSANTSSQSVLASSASRKSFTLFNASDKECYVAFAATATTSAYTIRMIAGSYYERALPNYTGAISCIWAESATGGLKVTELT